MPAVLVDEEYNGLNAVYGNACDWIDAVCEFSTRFSVGSGVSNTFTYNDQGGNYSLSLQSGNIGDFGFVAGMNVTFTWLLYGGPPAFLNQTSNNTITYISGNVVYFQNPITFNAPGGPFNLPNGTVFPTANQTSGILMVADQAPDAVEFEFNLTPNGQQSLNSVIDGSINRFELQDVDALPLATPTPMVQQGNQSGGWFKDVELEYISNDGDGWRRYKVHYKFLQWGVIQDGFNEPQYYDNADHLAQVVKVTAFAEYGNPNAVNEFISQNNEANTGGYDENYNGGVNNYSVKSIDFEDFLGDPIDAIDYSNPCTFTAVLDAPNQANPNSTYRLALCWRPIDSLLYQGLPDNIGVNLMFNASENDFIADGVTVPGPFLGETHPSGARWDFEDITFVISGVDEITITGKIVPNAACQTLFDQYGTDERRSTLSVSIANYNLVGVNADRVTLKLFDDDNIDAPTKGVQYPKVVDEFLYDHNDNDITAVARQTTTEDDVRYVSRLRLDENVVYEGINTRIFVRDSLMGDEFTLEELFLDFANQPYINGIHEVDITQPRNFVLPTLSDRNLIRLERDNTLDNPGVDYGIKLTYGFLNNWRYWLAQANADSDFFDPNVANNGQNKNWERYSEFATWDLHIGYYVRLNGVDDYQEYQYIDRPYEDNPSVTFVPTFTVVSTGQVVNAFPSNELVRIDGEFTWLGGNFDDWWTEFRVENKEGATLGVISSRWAVVNEPNNPFQPLPGQTQLQNVVAPANVLTASCLIDTSLFNVNEVSISYRVYSKPKGADFEYMVWETDVANVAYGLIKLSPNHVYPDASPAIRVYRQGDGATLDVGFVATGPGGQLELDTVTMLNFVNEFGADNGLVQWFYDQGGLGNDASQFTDADMAVIVNAGALVTDTNGNPAVSFNGASAFYNLTNPINNAQRYLNIMSFSRPAGIGIKSVGFAAGGASPHLFYWDNNDDLLSYMGAASQNHGNNATSKEYIMSTLRDSSDDIQMWLDTTPYTVRNDAAQANAIDTFGSINATDFHNGLMTTCIYYTSDFEPFRAALVATLNNYYNYY